MDHLFTLSKEPVPIKPSLFVFIVIGLAVLTGFMVALGHGPDVLTIGLGFIFIFVCLVIRIDYLIMLLFFLILIASTRQIGPWIFYLKKLRWVPMIVLATRGVLPILLQKKARTVQNYHGVHKIWLIFFCYITMFSFRSIDPMLSLSRAFAYFCVFIGVFLAAWNFLDEIDKIRLFLRAIKIVSLVALYVSLPVSFLFPDLVFRGGRYQGILGNSNMMGLLCGITILLIFFETFIKKGSLSLFSVFQLMFVSICLYLSGSRGGAGVAVIGVFILLFNSGFIRSFPYFFMIALLIFCFSVALYMGIKLPNVRQDSISLASTFKLQERSEVWGVTWDLIKQRPILGYGFGTGDKIFEYFNITFVSHQGLYAHNSYLQFWLETGFIGLVLMVAILYLIFRSSREIQRYAKNEETKLFAAMLMAFFIASCLNAVVESWMISPGSIYTTIFWLICAAILKVNVLTRQNREEWLVKERRKRSQTSAIGTDVDPETETVTE